MKKKTNEGLQKNYEDRIAETKAKIDRAIDKIKKEQGLLSVSNIARVSGVSRPTLYAHKDYIESKIPLKISKSNQVVELEETIKQLTKQLKAEKELSKELKQNNSFLVEINHALTLELKKMENN